MIPDIKIEFENLKTGIIRESEGYYNLEEIKHYFESHVDSRRSLSRVTSLADIFSLLQRRDLLHCNEVTSLKCLGEKLNNQIIIDLVKGYEKLFVIKETCVCGGTDLFTPIQNRLIEIDSLQQAIANVAQNIGKKWVVLIRHLNVKEQYIDDIRRKYPLAMSQQAFKALQIWIETDKNASIDVLKKALEARLCKNHGIGLHMLKPMVTIE